MSFLFIGSTGDSAGHTLLTWAILRRLSERGYRVGFVKPFGTRPARIEGTWTDHDALLFKEELALPESLPEICPYPLADGEWKEKETTTSFEDMKRSMEKLSHGKDVLVVMGSKHIFVDDVTRPLPDISIIPALEADLILVHRYRKVSKSVYSILSVCSLLPDSIKGIVFNRVATGELQILREKVVTPMLQRGVPVVTTIPEDPLLSSRSLREIRDILDGEVLCGRGQLEQPVASMTVGSSDLPAELMPFKRAYNKIVLLARSGEMGKEDPAPARPVAGILMTAGRDPASVLIQSAKRAEIPLILVREDTFAVLERLDQSPSILSHRDEAKIRRFSELLDGENSLDRLIDRLRLPR